MKATFLGTGTSSGVPLIGCECPVCRSADPRDRRRRASLHVQAAGQCLLVDTPPDFREAALAWDVRRVDAVLFTHAHADHIFGFDDIRRFNVLQGNRAIPAYAAEPTLGHVRRVFSYIENRDEPDLWRPLIEFRPVTGPFAIGDVAIEPLPVRHDTSGDIAVGYLFAAEGRRLAYVPDCKAMPDETLARIRGVDVAILDALRHRPHATHLSLSESLALLKRIGAQRSFITHMGHDLGFEATQASLPPGVFVPHDGLTVEG
jgi:phosphoribosyl 1,2-cyclic phosphate phosphodiesterase